MDIYDKKGKRLARLGDIFAGEKPGQFIAPHGLALNSRGDIYVGEVSWTIMGQHLKPPRELRSLQKLRKIDDIGVQSFNVQVSSVEQPGVTRPGQWPFGERGAMESNVTSSVCRSVAIRATGFM